MQTADPAAALPLKLSATPADRQERRRTGAGSSMRWDRETDWVISLEAGKGGQGARDPVGM